MPIGSGIFPLARKEFLCLKIEFVLVPFLYRERSDPKLTINDTLHFNNKLSTKIITMNQSELYTGGSSTRSLGRMDTGSTSRRPLSLCCNGPSEDKGDEGVTYELLLPAASSIGGGEAGVTMKPLGPRLLLGAMGVMGAGRWMP